MSLRLESISQLFEEHRDAGELGKAEEVGGVVLPANKELSFPLQPGKEALHKPAMFERSRPPCVRPMVSAMFTIFMSRTLTSGREAMSAHVLVDLSDGQHILNDLQTLLRERFNIEHTTVQLESDRSPLIKVSPGVRL